MTARRWPISALAIALSIATAGALAGCTPTSLDPTDPSTTAAPSPTVEEPSAEPSPTASGPTSVAIPAECRELVSASYYAATFEGVPLNDPAFGPAEVRLPQAPDGSEPPAVTGGVACVWADPASDITGLSAVVATVTASEAEAYLDVHASSGYTCTEVLEGRQCQLVSQNEQYPVEQADTVFLRDDTIVHVNQANFPTNGLIAEIVATLWP